MDEDIFSNVFGTSCHPLLYIIEGAYLQFVVNGKEEYGVGIIEQTLEALCNFAILVYFHTIGYVEIT